LNTGKTVSRAVFEFEHR